MSPNRYKHRRIGILMGGTSTERDISLKTGKAISAALTRLGYEHLCIDVDQDIALVLRKEKIDLAFIALHGRCGEDGSMQGLLEMMHIPYTGSGVAASANAMNKIITHDLLKAHDLPMPRFFVLSEERRENFDVGELPFNLPVVVKPVSEGSSIGVSIVKEADKCKAAIEKAFQFGNKVLIEAYISGMEVQVGILGDRALGAIEIQPKGEFYDYTAKYTEGMSEHIYPAPLPESTYREVLALATKAHQILGCRAYSRIDFLIDDNMKAYVLEINTLPGMTETSLMPEMAKENGIGFDDLVEEILNAARQENELN